MINITIEAFLLGISTGVYCFSQCGMVFIPYIFSEDRKNVKGHFPLVFQFLLGRFIAYVIVGLAVGYLGQTVLGAAFLESNSAAGIIVGASYIVLSALLIINALSVTKKESCTISRFKRYSHYPALLGIFTGINICPPFLLAVTKAANAGNMFMSTVFFVMFFLATSVFILPFVFSGVFKRNNAVKNIARMVSVLAGIYLVVQGISYIYNAIK